MGVGSVSGGGSSQYSQIDGADSGTASAGAGADGAEAFEAAKKAVIEGIVKSIALQEAIGSVNDLEKIRKQNQANQS